MECEVCGRELSTTVDDEGYCERHLNAYLNIKKQFGAWKRAENISWKEYLKELTKNEYTGLWAKELAEKMLTTGD